MRAEEKQRTIDQLRQELSAAKKRGGNGRVSGKGGAAAANGSIDAAVEGAASRLAEMDEGQVAEWLQALLGSALLMGEPAGGAVMSGVVNDGVGGSGVQMNSSQLTPGTKVVAAIETWNESSSASTPTAANSGSGNGSASAAKTSTPIGNFSALPVYYHHFHYHYVRFMFTILLTPMNLRSQKGPSSCPIRRPPRCTRTRGQRCRRPHR